MLIAPCLVTELQWEDPAFIFFMPSQLEFSMNTGNIPISILFSRYPALSTPTHMKASLPLSLSLPHLLQYVCAFLALQSPELLQKCLIWRITTLSLLVMLLLIQITVGLLCHEGTMPACSQLICQDYQAAFKPANHQPSKPCFQTIFMRFLSIAPVC